MKTPPPDTGYSSLRKYTFPALVLSSLLLLSACSDSDSSNASDEITEDTDTSILAEPGDSTDEVSDAVFDTPDWTEESHSNDVDPNFSEVFDDTQVKRLDFVVSEERWQSMLDDMTANYGEFGGSSAGGGGGAPPAGGQAGGGVPPDGIQPDSGTPPDEFQAGGPRQEDETNTLTEIDEDPIFVPADVYYNSKQWYRVGIRFKGNSSLKNSWQAGILKLSFKMDFDEYEDDYPQIDNQRFYGFKKFSLKNNYDDKSELREKVATDVFRAAGVPVSHTSFYELHIDHGNGPEYFGLYTLVEEVDGPVLDTQFSSDDGNLYKPEDGSANFVEGTFNPENFEKKTNEDDEDWSDIEALFSALHDETATTDPATWRTNLEAVFDVDGFLKYLAVNGIIQNWDTYGRMIHNYYLYNNPENGKLTWIPWDNNESLQDGKQGGSLALDFSDLDSAQWPLIAKIYADDVYKARYDLLLSEVMSLAFETSSIRAKYDNYSSLVSPYVTAELPGYSFLSNSSDFTPAIDALKSHATSRATAVESYLNSQ
ncbi:CotH kinase family protein [Granulosicoccus antarcticus]|uniref:Inner spore coat protein H n=1 Tax=Granulosicoccus antarcticus IMCC3135 TaxID=1192854 RepID=A0A2Z2NY23_9GAMM|nr:CotH kinase family protein [Granulosicoccus antarcticus]ASJ76352.1 Inner spore coat protein H [Granulosicoccus antarcticus IMCC3135]